MSPANSAFWSDYLRQTFQCYADSLVHRVAARLIKPRSQWPHEELIERCVAAMGNAVLLDRRLEELAIPCRRLLTCISHSGQPRWKLGNLLELLAALGFSEGPQLVFALFEAGLLYPDLLGNGKGSGTDPKKGSDPLNSKGQTPFSGQRTGPSVQPFEAGKNVSRLRGFEQWLGQGAATEFMTFAHPNVLSRALDGELGLPSCRTSAVPVGGIHEADGLELPLRLATIWQQTAASPLRRTMQGDFFKRDLDRLRSDPLLAAPPSDSLAELPDAGLLAVAWAQAEGILEVDQADLRAAALPASWDEGLPSTLSSLWATLPLIETWNPKDGWTGPASAANPYPSGSLLTLLLLAQLPEDAWARPEDLEAWILAHHPFWMGNRRQLSPGLSWVTTFLLGLAYPLRMLQAAKDSSGKWFVRLSPLGRRLLRLPGPQSENGPSTAPVRQTLLVQPNLEIIVYRQALTPALIARLSRFAAWKTLGAACTLQLQADSVYRGLESGLSFEAMLQTLEQFGMRPIPPGVVEALRTWADKRERISVYPSATLFEFATADDLDEALARGLPGIRLSDRLLAVAGDSAIDFRHFRLTGTRDYGLPPEKCVEVEGDGVTLAVDLARSDLLLETEIKRFAEPLDSAGVNGWRRYRLTPRSLAGGRDNGIGQRHLEEWFLQRAGRPLSPAVQLLLNGSTLPPVDLRAQLVLHVATPELADGLLQWSGTRTLIRDRLGPTALVIAADDVDVFKERLANLGMSVQSH